MNSPPSPPSTPEPDEFYEIAPEIQDIEEFCDANPAAEPASPLMKLKGDPILIGSSITTTHVKDLHELLQTTQYVRLGLRPVFDCEYTKSDKGFVGYSCTVRIVDVNGETVGEFQPDDFFPGKKGAREAAAKMGIDWVSDPRNLGARVSAAQASTTDAVDGQNWIGRLAEWYQKSKILPDYTYYARTGLGFSCELKLPSKNLTLSEVTGYKTFGDKTDFHRVKKQAKNAAAKAAMEYIDSQGGLSPQQSPRGGKSSGVNSAGGGTKPKPGTLVISPGTPRRQALGTICQRLNIELTFKFQPHPEAMGMFDGSVWLKKRWGKSKPARLGPQTCFGKEKGKDALAAKDGVKIWLMGAAKEAGVEIQWEKD